MNRYWVDKARFNPKGDIVDSTAEPISNIAYGQDSYVLAERRLKQLGYEKMDTELWEKQEPDWAEDIRESLRSIPMSVWSKVDDDGYREIVVICMRVDEP